MSETATMSSMDVTLIPDGRAWPGLARGGKPLSDRSRAFRQELGLTTERPVVMSGHQADFWHAGIVAKLFSLDATAGACDGQGVWLVVDQDVNAVKVWAPVRRASGELERRIGLDLSAAGGIGPDVPTGRRAAAVNVRVRPLEAGERYAIDGTASALQRMADALNRRAGEATLARQVTEASLDLLDGLMARPRVVYASAIGGTTLMGDVIRQMVSAPGAMAGAYNAAVSRHARARVATLDTSAPDDPEAPLWHLAASNGAARGKVHVSRLAGLNAGELVPRALLMTGMLRWMGCDLFIHGIGGAGRDGESGYDAITQEWLGEWLGAELSPMVMATSTMYLDIATPGGLITPEEIAMVRWKLHAANHRPSMLNDADGETARERAVRTLVELRRRRDERSRAAKQVAYRELHTTLESVRERHASELEAMKLAAEAAAARRMEAEIIGDRTWAFALHEESRLRELKASIERQIG